MTNPQNYAVVPVKWTPSVPVDIERSMGVQSIAETSESIRLTRAEAWFVQMMRQARATGKCGTLVARWDGQAWSFHICEPPVRINEA